MFNRKFMYKKRKKEKKEKNKTSYWAVLTEWHFFPVKNQRYFWTPLPNSDRLSEFKQSLMNLKQSFLCMAAEQHSEIDNAY